MVEGGLPGQTGAIFHFRPYLPISGVGKGLMMGFLNPFPTLFYLGRIGSGEAQTEACMALPGPAKGLAVATVTYINYPSRRKP